MSDINSTVESRKRKFEELYQDLERLENENVILRNENAALLLQIEQLQERNTVTCVPGACGTSSFSSLVGTQIVKDQGTGMTIIANKVNAPNPVNRVAR